MADKQTPKTVEEMDVARMALGGYQGLDSEKPASVEILTYTDGNEADLVYGMVNPCKFGDQCEGHACYCDHPNGPRKCRYSWYYGDTNMDATCGHFEPNPYWQGNTEGDFYAKREATLLALYGEGKLDLARIAIDGEAPGHYKGKQSVFHEQAKGLPLMRDV